MFQLYLEKIDGTDVEVLCALVEALSNTDPTNAEQYAQRLQVPSYEHLDPEALEAAPVPKITMPKKAESGKDAGGDWNPAGTDAEIAKKRRKKKVRYPKNFDPENPGPPPDPERWLPKTERTEYKKKMAKKTKNLFRGPQAKVCCPGWT